MSRRPPSLAEPIGTMAHMKIPGKWPFDTWDGLFAEPNTTVWEFNDGKKTATGRGTTILHDGQQPQMRLTIKKLEDKIDVKFDFLPFNSLHWYNNEESTSYVNELESRFQDAANTATSQWPESADMSFEWETRKLITKTKPFWKGIVGSIIIPMGSALTLTRQDGSEQHQPLIVSVIAAVVDSYDHTMTNQLVKQIKEIAAGRDPKPAHVAKTKAAEATPPNWDDWTDEQKLWAQQRLKKQEDYYEEKRVQNRAHYRYKPGGDGYFETKEHWDAATKS